MGPNALKYILNVARKSLVKDQGSGIMKVPGRMDAEAKASEIVTELTNAGLDLGKMDDFIRSEGDVLKYLNILEAAKKERMKPIPADSPRGREITEQLFGKRGEVVDMKGNVIPEGSGIMGGESIESLMKSGDVTKGTVTKKSKKASDRDMFRAANERFKKTDIDKIIKNINKLDPIEAMKEANKIIKRDSYYKGLSDKDAKRILTETEDHIFGRDVDMDPEDFFATGGRVGLKDGPPDPSRRNFLKIMGGLAALPIVGKFFKPAKVGKAVTKVPLVKTADVAGKPEWFDALVNKVILEGDDVTKNFATKDRELVYSKKIDADNEVTVYRDLDTDSIRVDYSSPNVMLDEPVSLSYTKGQADEATQGMKPADEFETFEQGLAARSNGPDDYTIDPEPNVGSSISDLETDVSKLKEYATGKGPTMKEFIASKKRKEKVKKINEGDIGETSDYVTKRQGDYYDYDDYASGGRVGLSSDGLAYLLGE